MKTEKEILERIAKLEQVRPKQIGMNIPAELATDTLIKYLKWVLE